MANLDDELRDVEYIPEPTDRNILSAVDPSVLGYEELWRSEVMGWAPVIPEPIPRRNKRRTSALNLAMFAIVVSVMVLLWENDLLIVELPLPDSEWAFESTDIRTLQEAGLTGFGIRLCMVDTGIDAEHEAFAAANIQFHDLVGQSAIPVEYGAIAHGTLMAGILLSTTHQQGIAPNVTFAMVAALQDDGTGDNIGDEEVVADAIEWCQFTFKADIISLSLGGQSTSGEAREGASVSATRQATDAGIFVVAAAGNDGGVDDDGDVSAPGNVRLAISVGASTENGNVWENSSIGSQFDSNGQPRLNPHKKPEIIAPGHKIISTGESNSWYSSSGTSDSTVFVAGTLALILEAHPELKPSNHENSTCLEAVKTALMSSSNGGGTAHDSSRGYGLLNAERWLNQVKDLVECV